MQQEPPHRFESAGGAVHLDERRTPGHVVPMSLGGAHTYGNVQPAHLECNLVKGDRAA
jgi:5-methylcytosine-specific restriction endonuclease McrA